MRRPPIRILWKHNRFLMIQSPSASCTRLAEGLSDAAVILFSRFSIFCSQIPLKYAILDAEGGERMERLIFHVDVNSAFLSWEAARRVAAGEADLRLIPSAIGGDRVFFKLSLNASSKFLPPLFVS